MTESEKLSLKYDVLIKDQNDQLLELAKAIDYTNGLIFQNDTYLNDISFQNSDPQGYTSVIIDKIKNQLDLINLLRKVDVAHEAIVNLNQDKSTDYKIELLKIQSSPDFLMKGKEIGNDLIHGKGLSKTGAKFLISCLIQILIIVLLVIILIRLLR